MASEGSGVAETWVTRQELATGEFLPCVRPLGVLANAAPAMLLAYADAAPAPPLAAIVAQARRSVDELPRSARRAMAVCDALAVAVAAGPPDRSGVDDHLVVLHVDAADLAAAASPDAPDDLAAAASADAPDAAAVVGAGPSGL